MKLTKIPNNEAEEIIVNGEDKAFSTFVLEGKNYTIYHRTYNDVYYDILEMITTIGFTEVSTFYILDPVEVKELFKN